MDDAMLLLESLSLKAFNLWAKSRGYLFGLASAPAEIEQALSCRRQVYLDSGYIKPGGNQTGQNADPDDMHAAIFFARWQDQCAGTMRLIPYCEDLPTLRLFNTRLPAWADRKASAEFGRYAVAHSFRGRERYASLGLAGACYQHSLRTGIRWWIGYAPVALLESFGAFIPGWQVLPEESPDERHLSARESLAGYFSRYGSTVKPFIIDVWQITWTKCLLRMARQGFIHRSAKGAET